MDPSACDFIVAGARLVLCFSTWSVLILAEILM